MHANLMTHTGHKDPGQTQHTPLKAVTMMPTNELFMPIAVAAMAWTGLITVGAMKLSRLSDQLVRQEARLNLIRNRRGIGFPTMRRSPSSINGGPH
jgi:hypothetical protein